MMGVLFLFLFRFLSCFLFFFFAMFMFTTVRAPYSKLRHVKTKRGIIIKIYTRTNILFWYDDPINDNAIARISITSHWRTYLKDGYSLYYKFRFIFLLARIKRGKCHLQWKRDRFSLLDYNMFYAVYYARASEQHCNITWNQRRDTGKTICCWQLARSSASIFPNGRWYKAQSRLSQVHIP